MEKLEVLALSPNQIKDLRLLDKLGKQNFHEVMKNLYGTLNDTIKSASENITKNISETSMKNNKAISALDKKVSELMNDKCMIAPYLVFSLVNLFKPENKSQFRLIKDLN